jgi:alkyl hydroperoxide reductase subunit AhpC
MPNVVAAYNKYKVKGFDVVGLSFDREKEPWVKAIVEWDMPWVHLSDLKYWQTVAADVYGVNSIPDNILINPEGRIVGYEVTAGNVGRNAEELLRKVQACQFVHAHGDQVCPANWKPGAETLKPSLDLVGQL